MNTSLKIGELAELAQCPPETIRFYEREGLLEHPHRTASNYRVYSRAQVQRLAFIRNCRSLDMTLEEIRELLRLQAVSQENCTAAHQVLDEHIAHVAARVTELQQLERQLKALRRRCKTTVAKQHCAILDDLGQSSGSGKVGKGGVHHVSGAHSAHARK